MKSIHTLTTDQRRALHKVSWNTLREIAQKNIASGLLYLECDPWADPPQALQIRYLAQPEPAADLEPVTSLGSV